MLGQTLQLLAVTRLEMLWTSHPKLEKTAAHSMPIPELAPVMTAILAPLSASVEDGGLMGLVGAETVGAAENNLLLVKIAQEANFFAATHPKFR